MTHFKSFFNFLRTSVMNPEIVNIIEKAVSKNWDHSANGNLPRLLEILNRNRLEEAELLDLKDERITFYNSKLESKDIKEDLVDLMPWRKGPFQVNDIHIDSEWQCNKKWQRIENTIDFNNKNILDIGSGNGYYGYKMIGSGAKSVTAIDPSLLSVIQFLYLNKLSKLDNLAVLPLALEDLENQMPQWDIVLSMGVLYHRKSPLDHLESAKNKLVPGGTFILETLVIEGGINQVLVPEGRYAMMNNIYFLPSTQMLCSWLRKIGFIDIEVINESYTSTDEQRCTEWKKGTSLIDYIKPEDCYKTIENHPAPMRAIIIAKKPEKDTKLPRYRL